MALCFYATRVVSEEDNSTFLDLLEGLFCTPEDILKNDERPELSYQVGATLELTENRNVQRTQAACVSSSDWSLRRDRWISVPTIRIQSVVSLEDGRSTTISDAVS